MLAEELKAEMELMKQKKSEEVITVTRVAQQVPHPSPIEKRVTFADQSTPQAAKKSAFKPLVLAAPSDNSKPAAPSQKTCFICNKPSFGLMATCTKCEHVFHATCTKAANVLSDENWQCEECAKSKKRVASKTAGNAAKKQRKV